MILPRGGFSRNLWKEIDLVEEAGGRLHGFELKWREADVRPPKSWSQAYQTASFSTVHPGNYLDFVS